jgi:hypothetical protein
MSGPNAWATFVLAAVGLIVLIVAALARFG